MSEEEEPIIDPVLKQMLRQERADLAWARYVMNEQPAALAEYLFLGGEVDDQVRAALVNALEHSTVGRKGGNKPFEDWQTYLGVQETLLDDAIDRKIAERSDDNNASKQSQKPMSLTKAKKAFAKKPKGKIKQNHELRTIEIRYQRGEKIEKQFKKSTK